MSIFANFLNTIGVRRVELGREEVTATAPLADREFLVPTMVCEGCAEKIAGALTSIPGVRDVTSKVTKKRIRVRYEPEHVREQQLKDALTKIGFEVLDAGENT
ncbi:MAG: heavy-metal-associated domain-containing protein [Acidobacteria bacterium]|nr:heavy-metal-associated domain-containing protein [Acidobacteriota bacterium]